MANKFARVEFPPRFKNTGLPFSRYFFGVTGSDGRKIAAYRFGDVNKARFSRASGRTGLSKQIKNELILTHGSKCFICLEVLSERELQIDHRVPFEVDGEPDFEPEKGISRKLRAYCNAAG
ncbi:hypothetical protein [Rivularia sp. PCC 7116]|uniref:hypothetical protein n=1 Tax=Rivularia sp. PCC 7116 TaxID=373994 RepID=UPI00031BDBCF|nr:hypothetical protein [Rivularia sp. PCC 7116]